MGHLSAKSLLLIMGDYASKDPVNCLSMNIFLGDFFEHWVDIVSSSAERGIMCDKILSPDTLNIDMGDFI